MSSIPAGEDRPDCVLAIPCFRESQRLPGFLRALCVELGACAVRVRIQVVDDGSGEPEASALRHLVDSLREEFPSLLLEPLLLEKNRGKGGAVYAGWKHALPLEPRALALVDADGSVPPQEVRRLMERFLGPQDAAWDAIFAARLKILGRKVDRRLHRHLLGRVFATAVTAFTGMEVYDSQCGFKLLRTNAFTQIADQLHETGFVFDVELALVLLKAGYRVREIPIDWRAIPGSKVHLVLDSLRMFAGLRTIQTRHGRLSARRGEARD